MFRNIFTRWRSGWNSLHDEHTAALDQLPSAWLRLAVVVASALTLFVQLLIVRWHSTCFHDFNVFKNVSLLSCFLGLGIGYGISGRARVKLASFLPLLAVQALLFGLLSKTSMGQYGTNPVAEQFIMGSQGSYWRWSMALRGNLLMGSVFVLNALMFIPLGHLAGRLMTRLPKMQSYALNLLGSLAGIGVYFWLSLLWSPPTVWLGVAVLGLAPFLIGQRSMAAVAVASTGVLFLSLGILGDPREERYYSPYQLIALRLPEPTAAKPVLTLSVNHLFFQQVIDCSTSKTPHMGIVGCYNLPQTLAGKADDVLVVGAGTGNDVAAALRHGAHSVTAVEIDPTILYLGERLHPERPYHDPRTRIVLNDARSFLRQTEERFDLIVYGLLDSHTNLGSLTNMRLDSFVYTVEGFRDAVRRLKDDGVVVVSYAVFEPKQAHKFYAMLCEAYPEQTPRVFSGIDYGGPFFITGPGLHKTPAIVPGANEITSQFLNYPEPVEVATDDWPFLYLKGRTYPLTYALMVLLLLALSAVLVKQHVGTPQLLDANSGLFFFLGAGFMLIETKGITELGLVFGNTWSVVAVVISGILLMGFLANLWVMTRGAVASRRSFALLGGALLLGLVVTRLSMAGFVLPWPRLLMPLVLTSPLFFAGLIFSSRLAGAAEIGPALSANLFGAMLGGFLEYNSMYWGYSSLYPLGMVLYALAFWCQSRADRQQAIRTDTLPERQAA